MLKRPPPAYVAGAFVAVVALLAHVVALRAGYVLDDDALLARNPWVHAAGGWRGLLTHELFEASGEVRYAPYYRPLSGLLYWASSHVLGDGSGVQHGVNIALHALVSVLVFALIRAQQAGRVRIAAFVAALFAAHPATAELVAYVGGRQDLSGWMATLGGLSIAERLRARGQDGPRRAALVAFVTFATVLVAAGFREFFLTIGAVFVVAPAIEAAHGPRPLTTARRAGALAAPLIGWGLAVLANVTLRHVLRVGSLWGIEKDDPDTLGVFSGTLLRLLHDALLPTDLAIDVTIDHRLLAATLALIACVGAITYLYRTAAGSRERELLAYGALLPALIAVSHVPVVQTNGCFSDRYAYGFLLGVMLVAAAVVARLVDGVAGSISRLEKAWPVVFAVPLALCPTTWSREADFVNEDTLIAAMVRERPDDPESAFAAGMFLVGEGRYLEAGPLCERWRARHPVSDRANLCLAQWHLARGEPRLAADLAAAFLESRPGHARGREVLFAALVASGQLERARAHIDGLLRVFPGDEQLLDQRRRLAAVERAR